MSDIPRKSTPLSEGKCPEAAHVIAEQHAVSKAGENEYTCTCGAEFLWQDQMHWQVTKRGSGVPNIHAPEADFAPSTDNATGQEP